MTQINMNNTFLELTMHVSIKYLVPALALLSGGAMTATESGGPIGPRALGMGGAQVACSVGIEAQYYNPATFAFMGRCNGNDDDDPDKRSVDNAHLTRKRFGITPIDLQVGVTLTGELGEMARDLADIDYEGLGTNSELGDEDIEDLLVLASSLSRIDDPNNNLFIDINLGAGVRWGSLAFGARAFGHAVARVDELDRINLGLNYDSREDLNDWLNDLAAAADITPGGSYTQLNPDQQTAIADALGTTPDAASVLYVDSQLNELITTGAITMAEVDETLALLIAGFEATDGDESNNLDNNRTSILLRGLAVAEVPVSYGVALNDRLAIGVTGRFLLGRVYGSTVLVFDDDNDEVIENIKEQYEESMTWGIDVGLLYRMPSLQIGITGRNLNRPRFDGFSFDDAGLTYAVDDIHLDPQVTVGVAWIPHPTLTVAADIDLLETDGLLPNFGHQYVRCGLEWDAFRFLALRAGAYRNIALDDPPTVVTAGLGFNFYLVRIDLAAAAAIDDRVSYRGTKYPQTARVGLGVSIDF